MTDSDLAEFEILMDELATCCKGADTASTGKIKTYFNRIKKYALSDVVCAFERLMETHNDFFPTAADIIATIKWVRANSSRITLSPEARAFIKHAADVQGMGVDARPRYVRLAMLYLESGGEVINDKEIMERFADTAYLTPLQFNYFIGKCYPQNYAKRRRPDWPAPTVARSFVSTLVPMPDKVMRRYAATVGYHSKGLGKLPYQRVVDIADKEFERRAPSEAKGGRR